jgi:uncharacterized iron-regulated membrane protein
MAGLSRAQWLRLHRVVGLIAAAFLFVQALTGMLLVYDGPAARLIDPQGMTSYGSGRQITAGSAIERAATVMPGYAVTRVFAPGIHRQTWFVQLAADSSEAGYVSIDPAGGAVLRKGGLLDFPVEAALQIHYRFALGKAGMTVIALNAAALLFMAMSGLKYWWPRRNPGRALRVQFSLPPRAVLRQAHRTTGVSASAFLIVLAGTGLTLVVPDLLAPAGPSTLPPRPSATAVDRALATAGTAFPGHALRDFRVGDGQVVVNFDAPERNVRAIDRATVTLADARLKATLAAKDNGALWLTTLPIHTGEILGAAGSLSLLLVSLTVLGLCLSGPLMWWQATRQRRPRSSDRSM